MDSTIKRYNGSSWDTLDFITVGQNVYGSGINATVQLLDNNDQINSNFLTNYVTINTTQDISGLKTFTNPISITNINNQGPVQIYADTNNTGKIKWVNSNIFTFGEYINYSGVTFVPLRNNQLNLGNSSYLWKDLFLAGSLQDGTNSITIAKIESTDNKVTSISSSSTDTQYPSAKCVYDSIEAAKTLIPDNTDYVDLTTNQVISGQKDFNTVPRVKITHETHDLPSEYQETQYIESTGTQYIDTGLIGTANTSYLVTAQAASNTPMLLFGSRTSATSNNLMCTTSEAYCLVDFGNYQQTRLQVTVSTNKFTAYNSKNLRYVNNTQSTIVYSDSITTPGTMRIFDLSGNPPTGNVKWSGKIFICKVWESDVLLREFIPCYRKSDNEVGLYDIVNDVFYTNQGTGNLVAGPSVNPVTYENLLTDANIPTKTSQLSNDSGYITNSYHDSTKANQSEVTAIQAKIPSAASSSNQLADKAFVNSSIETATATFRGTFESLQELEATSGDLNDYAFYKHTDAAGNTVFDRYKYVTTTPHWVYEYTLNNSSFTATQWAAINSGVTSNNWVDISTAQTISGQKDFNTIPRVKVEHETHNLPSEYQEIEYIESDGTQYINTGFIPSNNNYGFDIDLLVVDTPNTANGYIGYRSVSAAAIAGDMRYCFIYGDKRLAIRNGVNADNSTLTIALNQKYNFNYSSGSLKINGVEQASCTQYSANPTFKTFYLFKANTDNYYSADLGTFTGRIYEAKLYDNGTLVRDFIPCYRISDNEPGMYDLETETFFVNSGTGDFEVGPDIEVVTYESLLTDASFASVATTGNYNDLLNKPTIPTVNNAILTIQKNGTTVNTFTANASSNVTANITVPTTTNDLTNNSGFITANDIPLIFTDYTIGE